MNKKQLIENMSNRLNSSQTEVKKQLDMILLQLRKALTEGEKVYLPQFGTFELRYHLSKMGRHPRSGEVIEIPGFNQPSFKPAPALKQALQAPK